MSFYFSNFMPAKTKDIIGITLLFTKTARYTNIDRFYNICNNKACKKSKSVIITIANKVIMGKDGRILIPASIRKEMGLKEGDSLLIKYNKEELNLSPIKAKIKQFQNIVKSYNKKQISLVDSLRESRGQENE